MKSRRRPSETFVDSKNALAILHEQIVEGLLSSSKSPSSIRCGIINDWTISHNQGTLSLSGPYSINTEPQKPPWIDFRLMESDDKFEIETESEPYLNDFIGFLLESWRIKQNNPNISSEEALRESLLRIAERWKLSREPLSENKQKELIGELTCVSDAFSIRGVEAIDSWDIDGHALFDIDSPSWIIESKATSSDPESVILSSPGQVDFRVEKTLVLGVTRLKKKKDSGIGFPEIVANILEGIPQDERMKLQLGLMNRGYSSSPLTDKKFTTRWVVQGTRYLPITVDSNVIPCEIFDDIPDTILSIRQKLNTSGFPDSDLKDLIGG